MGKPKIFVDGDLAAFPSASVCDERIYLAKDQSGRVVGEFQGAKAHANWLLNIEEFGIDMEHGFTGDVSELTRELVIRPKPFKEAKKAFKGLIDQWVAMCPEGDVTVYLAPMSGQTNFRHDVALRKPYKGNRSSDKPTHLQALREWAFTLPYTKRATKFETDDIVCGMAHRHGRDGYVVQAEKDIYGSYNCWILHPAHQKEPVWSDPNIIGDLEWRGKDLVGLGRLFVLAQGGIFGDTADNYSGLDGAGPAKAWEVLSQFKNEPIEALPDAVAEVVKLYQKKYGDEYQYTNKHGERAVASWYDFYEEGIRLAYMLKNRKDYPHELLNPAKEIFDNGNS